MSLRPRRPNTVKIDGSKVRDLRESRGLTQLYIAEVTRVSVDTVSRWENNRTQAIRPDNADALAQALEVELEEILLAEQAPASPPAPPPQRPLLGLRLGWIAAAVGILGLVAAAGWYWLQPSPPELRARRRLPAYTAPGTQVPVLVSVQVASGNVRRVVLREHIPSGWSFVRADPAPDHGPDPAGQLRWILATSDDRARVAYVLRAPAAGEEGTAHRLRGEVVTPGKHGRTSPVQGDNRIDIEFIHWSDEDGDFHIGDGELLDALERVEATQALGMDTRVLRELWGAGEYHWIAEQRLFRPLAQSAPEPP